MYIHFLWSNKLLVSSAIDLHAEALAGKAKDRPLQVGSVKPNSTLGFTLSPDDSGTDSGSLSTHSYTVRLYFQP